MKKWWFGEKKYLVTDAAAAKQQAKADMRRVMDCGDEEGYVALVKALKPGITPCELVSAIERFRQYQRNRALGEQNPS